MLPFEDNELYQIKRWNADSTNPEPQTDAEIVKTESLDEANVVSSRQRKPHYVYNLSDDMSAPFGINVEPSYHTPVLDIDIPATLVPSSTPGKSHLYIDAPMSWENYQKLITVLGEVGILEPGYVSASIKRGFTAVRLPWIRKPVPIDPF